MCKHFWMVDACNKGRCKLCGESRDFQLGINRILRTSKKSTPMSIRSANLCPTEGYYIQGRYADPVPYHTTDYCFSVDNVW
jgi:hypothetical protein